MELCIKIFKSVLDKLTEKMGYNKLSRSFTRYLGVYICYMIASLLSSAYFNVFLLKAIGSSDALAWYNLLLACLQPVVMVLAIPVLRRKSINFCQQVGLGMHALAYLCLSFNANISETMVYVISCVFSAGNAFYYTSYTPQILAYTEDESRDVAYGSMGFMSTLGSLTLPLITGFFISAFGDLVGYRIMFFASSFALVIGILLSFRLTKVNVKKNVPLKQTWHIMKRMISNRDMLVMLIITMLTAAEVSGKAYYGSVLVYELLREESVIGVVTTVGGIVGLLANLVYGKIVKPQNRGSMMLAGAVLTFAATSLLNFSKTSYGYIIYFTIYSFSSFFIATPVVTEYMQVLQNDKMLGDYGAEVHACREFFYASGRILGLIPAFVIPASVSSASALLILIVILQIISAVMMIYIQKTAGGEKSEHKRIL